MKLLLRLFLFLFVAGAMGQAFEPFDAFRPFGPGAIDARLAALEVTTVSLPSETNGQEYSEQLAATGGDPPYVWSLDSGALPSGVSLSAGGLISGTLDGGAGQASFTIQCRSRDFQNDTQALTIDVYDVLAVTTTSLPDEATGNAYSEQLAATGGNPPYAWSLDSGSLPSGLTLSGGGLISGTLDGATAEASFTVALDSDDAQSDTQALTVFVYTEYAVTSSDSAVNTTTFPDVLPGDHLILDAGTRDKITFEDIVGIAARPIIIRNQNTGKTTIDATSGHAFRMLACEHFRLTGTGHIGTTYGIEVTADAGNQTNIGLNLTPGTREYEVDHIEIHTVGIQGLSSKTVSTDGYDQSWAHNGLHIHDCYIHDVGAEGIYIGKSTSWPNTTDPLVTNVHIHDMNIDDAEWDGIQIGLGTENISVHDIVLTDIGSSEVSAGNAAAAIVINGGTTGEFYNLEIRNPYRRGIYAIGQGGYEIYNNLIVDAGQGHADSTSSGMVFGSASHNNETNLIANNTIVNSYSDGINLNSGPSWTNTTLAENLVCASGGTDIIGQDAAVAGNLEYATEAAAGFVNAPGEDFHLASGSPAEDAATATRAAFDLENNPRPVGSDADVGSYERQ